ncbi:MAG: hypothetical protein ACM31E_11215 [Fibrobacterota bacterium]
MWDFFTRIPKGFTCGLEPRNANYLYINVNNHYEGSSPLTIRKMEAMLGGAPIN